MNHATLYQIGGYLVVNLLMLAAYIVSVTAQLNCLKALPPVRRLITALQHIAVLIITTAAYLCFIILFNTNFQ